jgi:hypothetical protein
MPAKVEFDNLPAHVEHTAKYRVVADWQNYDGDCSIFINDFQVYIFKYHSLSYLAGRLPVVMKGLCDFPVSLDGRTACQELLGRKIWWREVPAVIENFLGESGTIQIRADNEEKLFPHYPWTAPEDRDDRERNYRINVDLFDPQLWWFRE